MKIRHITCIIILLAVLAAGCAASSPSTPLQIPTTVEYLGGDVTGDIAVLTANTVTFVAKDADGNDADASDVTVTLTKPDGESADSEYGSCAASTENASYIDCTGPDVLPSDVNPRVDYTFTLDNTSASISAGKNGAAGSSLGQYTGLIVVSPETVEGGTFTFTRLGEINHCQGSTISTNGAGWLFLACLQVISQTNSTIQIYWSNNDGIDLQGPMEITGVSNNNIIRAMKILPSDAGNTASAILTYNVSNGFKVVEIAGTADGDITIGTTYTSNGTVYDAYYAIDGTVHIIADMGTQSCPYNPEDFIKNVYYMKLSVGQFSSPTKINSMADCSVKATSGNEPKIAAAGSGNIYAVWRSIGDSGQAEPSLISLYATKLSPADGSVIENIAIFDPVTVEGTQWASGQDARVDKDGNLVTSWDVSAVSGATSSLSTYLSLFSASDPFTSYLIDQLPLPTGDIDSVIQDSGTRVIPDFANDYHMYYRNSESLLYVLASLGSDGLMTETTPIAISTAGNLVTGFLDADADWSGKNFVTWQEQQNETGVQIIVLALGTTQQ